MERNGSSVMVFRLPGSFESDKVWGYFIQMESKGDM